MITPLTKISEIEVLKPYEKYLIYKSGNLGMSVTELTFEEACKNQPSWNVTDMIWATEGLVRFAEEGNIMYDVYSEEECLEDKEKQDVKLFYFPTKKPSNKPFVISMAGGGYATVCSILESIPTALHLSELGYNVFVLNYRVLRDSLMPMPLEDLAAAVGFILSNHNKFNLENKEYVVNGFSAGANLACLWGTEVHGYAHYNLPKPKALIPIYPIISWEHQNQETSQIFQTLMFGKGFSKELVESYDIPKIFTISYPPCFIVHAKDDTTAPYENSVHLKELCDSYGVSAELLLVEHGNHGFGDGIGTEAENWILLADKFLQTL